ncbi:MAG: hypothetical protein FJY97_13290 [candidate division Zixibacteria bacterium]|nr:hypothetical protein [candidate division Zixibacteria bacterium]
MDLPHPPPYRLTAEQIVFFKTNGYLILERFIDKDTLINWREQLWTKLGSRLETPETWPRDQYAINDFRYDPPESAFGRYPPLLSIIEQLGGDAFVGGTGTPIVSWPRTDIAWEMPESGHIDAYGPGGWSPFMIGATTYAYDVEPGGGGFVYWPSTHHVAHRYFMDHPTQVDGSFRDIEGWNWKMFAGDVSEGPKEFTAAAGSVVLWHAYLTHTGSINMRATPRFGLFARWSHRRCGETEFRYEIPEDLWKYWAV